jgi:contractile injection system tube protein
MMERVTFLVEVTGARLACMLNPETVEAKRVAGVRPRKSSHGALTGAGLPDDPLIYTSGGTTQLHLDLLFDVTIAGSSARTEDVRDLTAPVWQLSENAVGPDGYGHPTLVRFVWGKSWNVPGILSTVAERFERFTPAGVPQRSWMRVKFLRVTPQPSQSKSGGQAGAGGGAMSEPPAPEDVPPDQVQTYAMIGSDVDVEGGRGAGERLDEIAFRAYGDPSKWRTLAKFNKISDPMRIGTGFGLKIPSAKTVHPRL